MREVERVTADNAESQLNIALSYTAREEITQVGPLELQWDFGTGNGEISQLVSIILNKTVGSPVLKILEIPFTALFSHPS